MRRSRLPAGIAPLVFGLALIPDSAFAAEQNWAVSVYAGPSTNYIFTEVLAGRYHWEDMMVGIAADRKLAYLGWGWSLEGEGQVTQHFFGHQYNTIAAGLGLKFDQFPWSHDVPTSFALYMGPSWTFNPPQQYPRSEWGSKKGLLNYLSFELAFEIPRQPGWDVEIRTFHRSGAWGIYTLDPDESSMIGLGIRKRF